MPQKPAKADVHESRRILARNVRRRRQALKLTLKAVSRRAQLHWRHWQKIEAGEVNVTLETLVRLSGALEMKLHLLLTPCELDPTAAQRAAYLVDELFTELALRDRLIERIAQELR
jgi:transcriptional regulator with XRE-family HTH domain